MTKENLLKERMKYFFLGMLVVIGTVFLMGANNKDSVVIDNGRFQVSAWGDGKAHGAFVIDTISGETKIVYRYKELGDKKSLERNYLNEPFIKIK